MIIPLLFTLLLILSPFMFKKIKDILQPKVNIPTTERALLKDLDASDIAKFRHHFYALKANPNMITHQGKSLMQHCVGLKNKQGLPFVKLLLEEGANVDVLDKQ